MPAGFRSGRTLRASARRHAQRVRRRSGADRAARPLTQQCDIVDGQQEPGRKATTHLAARLLRNLGWTPTKELWRPSHFRTFKSA
jgi:hypothetical protein